MTDTPMDVTPDRSLRDRAYRALSDSLPIALLLTLLSPLLSPASISPGTITLVGLVVGGLYAAGAGLTSPKQLRGSALAAVCLTWLAALWFTIATLWATNPHISLFGNTNANNGAALWVMLAAWLTASTLLSRARAVRWALAAVVFVGVMLTVTIIAELATTGIRSNIDTAAGMLTDSLSAAEVLAISTVAALAGALTHRNPMVRALYASILLPLATGLYLEQARTGWLALGLALSLAFLIAKFRTKRAPAILGVGTVALVLTVSLTLALAATGVFGDAALAMIDRATNYRASIWAGAVTQFETSPIVGKGLDQFTFLQEWSIVEYGLTSRGTFDPHSLVLAVALGGGVIGLTIVAGLFAALLTSTTEGAQRYRTSSGAALIAASPAVLLGSGLAAWLSPTAALCTVVLSGLLAGSVLEDRPDAQRDARLGIRAFASPALTGALVVGALSLAAGVGYGVPYRTTYEYAAAQEAGSVRLTSSDLMRMYRTFPDPKIGGTALMMRVRYEQPFSADDIEAVMTVTQRDTVWAANLAQEHLNAHVALLATGAEGEFSQNFGPASERAAAADPLTGAWDTISAIAADSIGLDDEASKYADLALEHPIPDEYAGMIQDIAEHEESTTE